jgi:hypothetical protein
MNEREMLGFTARDIAARNADEPDVSPAGIAALAPAPASNE